MKNQIPWKRLMAFGLGVLRLSPEKFWQMSLTELHAAVTGTCGAISSEPLTRNELEQLMTLYPDKENKICSKTCPTRKP